MTTGKYLLGLRSGLEQLYSTEREREREREGVRYSETWVATYPVDTASDA